MTLRWGAAGLFAALLLAFWPWWEGAGLTPRWCVLAVGVPALLHTLRIRPTTAHWLGAALLAWAALSLLWTPVWQSGVQEWVKLALIGGCFVIGAELEEPFPVYGAIALVVALNGLLALAQSWGFTGVPQLAPPAGTFVNRNYLAEIGAVVFILAVGVPRLRWLAPAVALAAILPHSRGVLLALILAGLCWVWQRSRLLTTLSASVLLALGVTLLLASPTLRDVMLDNAHDSHVPGNALDTRIEVWTTTLRHLTLQGHGVGSFMADYPTWTPHALLLETRPAQAHNEVLHEAAELGLPGIVLLAGFFVYCLGGALETERLALVALLAIGLWSFPFHLPATGALAGLVAGRLARSRAALRERVPDRRAAACLGV